MSLMKNYENKVTFVVCTCCRLESFIKSMENFFENCLDHELIYEYIVFDDSSSDDERNFMLEKYPKFNFIFKKFSEKGHAKSLNMIPKYVKTKYFINWEDDTEFIYPRNYISESIDILESQNAKNHNIKQVLFNDSGFSYYQKNDKNLYLESPTPIRLHTIDDESLLPESADKFIVGFHHWPGYSDNAYLMHTDVISKVGNFIEESSTSEVDFSIRFRNLGFKTCYLVGTGLRWNSKVSAYVLNNQNRWWDNCIIGVELAQLKYIFTHFFEFKTWKHVWYMIIGKI